MRFRRPGRDTAGIHSRCFGQCHFEHLYGPVRLQNACTNRGRQEQDVTLADRGDGTGVMDLTRTVDTNQHARCSDDTNSERQRSAEAPQLELRANEQLLALSGCGRFPHR